MAGPGGREVGRLSVRVLPDTSRFAVSLQRYLDRIERRAQVKVKVRADFSEFRRDLAVNVRRFNNSATVLVDVYPDLSGFQERLSARLATVRREVDVPVSLELRNAEITRLRAQLASLYPPISIPARLDAGRFNLSSILGGSGITRATSGLNAMSSAAGSAAGGIGKLRVALVALTTAAGAVPALASLTGSIKQLGPAAAIAAPALLSTALAGGALFASFKGLGEAVSEGGDALAKLPPRTRAFAREVRATGSALAKMQDGIRERMFAGWGAEMRNMNSTLLPNLRTGLNDSAKALNGWGTELFRSMSRLSSSGVVGYAMKGASQGLSDLRKSLAVAAEGFWTLAAAATPAWLRMTSAMGRGLDSLSAKLRTGLIDGSIEAAINRGVETAKQFGRVLRNVGTLWNNIFGPASDVGAGALDRLEKLTQGLSRVTGTETAQAGFKALWQLLSDLSGLITGALGSALRTVIPILSEFVQTIQGPLSAAIKEVSPVIDDVVGALGDALAPVVRILGKAFAELAPILATVAQRLGAALVPVIRDLSPLITKIADAVMNFLAPALEKLPQIIQPFLDNARELAPILADVGGKIMEQVGPALKSLGESFANLLTQLAPLMAGIGGVLIPLLQRLMPVISLVISVWGKWISLLTDGFAWVIENVVTPVVQGLVKLLSGDLNGAAQSVMSAFGNLRDLFEKVFGRVKAIVTDAVGAVVREGARMATDFVGSVTRMGTQIIAGAGRAMSGMGKAISSGVRSAVKTVAGLPAAAKRGLGNLGGVLKSAGKSLIDGFISGVRGAFDRVRSTLSNLTSMLPDWKGPAPLDKRILTPAGTFLIEGFMRGIAKRIPDVKRQLGGLTSDIPAMVGRVSLVGPDEIPSGLQPGDRIALTVDGQHTLDAVIERGASQQMFNSLVNPAARGRYR